MRGIATTLGAAGAVIGAVMIAMGILRGAEGLVLVGAGVVVVALAVAGAMRRPDTWPRSVFMAIIAFAAIYGVWWALAQF